MIIYWIRRLLLVCLGLLSLFAAVVTYVAYQVSPLRDPSFMPMSANAGATVDWLRPERYWMMMVNLFSVAMATNLTLLALLWSQRYRLGSRSASALIGPRIGYVLVNTVLKALGLATLWIVSAYGIWLTFLFYLLWQYIVD